MNRLTDIPVRAEYHQESSSNLDVATKVLREVQRLLARFIATGEAGTIDLRAQPHMEPSTYRHLRQALTTGEVTALIDADIKVEVTETQYPGVWWLTHRNADDEIVTEIIDITLIPDILKTHVAEMRAGLKRLDQALSASAA
jgi:hydrogenase-1 operon protein HyaF